jgi:hypothetical protein
VFAGVTSAAFAVVVAAAGVVSPTAIVALATESGAAAEDMLWTHSGRLP